MTVGPRVDGPRQGAQAATKEVPDPKRPSYAGEAVEGLEALVGRLSVRPSWRAVLAQEPPPRPVFLRNGHGRSHLFLPSSPHVLGERWTAALEPLDSRAEEEKEQGTINDR